jgi:predicted RecA/RadA family phage recombinase
MATTFVQNGNTIDHVATAAISSGDVVVIGSLVGVAKTDAAIGDTVAVAIEGVWEIPAATAAITLGAAVYWDVDGDPVGGTAGSGAATATATDNTQMGYAIEAKDAGVATVLVKLDR